jgi:glycerate 2-kinase
MNVLIAMDSFKGNLDSLEVAKIVECGIKKVYKDAIFDKVAIADGGEGTVRALVEGLNGEYIRIDVSGPLGDNVTATYGIVDGSTAIIEMAEASGLSLVPKDKRNPLITSTFGTGELIADALKRGCRKVILGIGGSATNDGGMGMAAALGVKFLDKHCSEIGYGGGCLDKLVSIDISSLNPGIKETEFLVACDVNNFLCGEKGASKVYGPQKGATPEMVVLLDRNLLHYSEIIKKQMSVDIGNIPGAGAAGGLGAGLLAFCGAVMSKGIDLVLDTVKIEERIKNVDIVITGEGRVDGQTIYGKVPVGIAARAKKYNKPIFAIAGFIDEGAELVYDFGIDAVMSSMVGPLSLEEAIKQSPKLIEEAAERLFRIIRAVKE